MNPNTMQDSTQNNSKQNVKESIQEDMNQTKKRMSRLNKKLLDEQANVGQKRKLLHRM